MWVDNPWHAVVVTREATEAAEDWDDTEVGGLAEELTELLEEVRGRVDELLSDFTEAVDLANAIASLLRQDSPADAAKTEKVARDLANLRSGHRTTPGNRRVIQETESPDMPGGVRTLGQRRTWSAAR